MPWSAALCAAAAVLMDRSGLTKRQSGIVVINRPEHQLPLFILTFEHASQRMMDAMGGMTASMAQRLAAMGLPAAQLQRLLGSSGARPPPPPPPRYRPPAAPRGKGKGKARARK